MKLEPAYKGKWQYTGKINGKTYVVPHSKISFHSWRGTPSGHTDAVEHPHSLVTSRAHVEQYNPNLTPEEISMVHKHIKDIHHSLSESRRVIHPDARDIHPDTSALLKLQNKALKAFPQSPRQKEIQKQIQDLRIKMKKEGTPEYHQMLREEKKEDKNMVKKKLNYKKFSEYRRKNPHMFIGGLEEEKKFDIYHKGQYHVSTAQSKTAKEAKEKYLKAYPKHHALDVTVERGKLEEATSVDPYYVKTTSDEMGERHRIFDSRSGGYHGSFKTKEEAENDVARRNAEHRAKLEHPRGKRKTLKEFIEYQIIENAQSPEPLTTKLNNGITVLAKMYKGSPSAVTYANATQAHAAHAKMGPGWRVHKGMGRPWYIAKKD